MSSDSKQSCSRSISSTILQGVKCFEQEAWNRLYAMWQPVVYALCRRAGLAPHDAEEVVQNVFLKVSRSIHAFQRQSFRGWIATITRNTITDHHRRCQGNPAVFGGSGSWLEKVAAPSAASDCDESGNTGRNEPNMNCQGDCSEDAWAETVPENSALSLIHRLLAVLRRTVDCSSYEAFRLTVIEGRRAVDVAEELGMSADAVRAAKYRMLKRIRQEWERMV